MRFIANRWFLGPLVALVALYVCAMFSVENATFRTEDIARRSVSQVYELASKGKYDELAKSGMVSANDIRYLKMQDVCFGPISHWELTYANSSWLGGSWTGTIQVTRIRTEVSDSLSGSTPHSVSMEPDYGENKLNDVNPYSGETHGSNRIDLTADLPGQKPITSEAEVVAQAKLAVKSFDRTNPVSAERRGDFWVVSVKALVDAQSSEDGATHTTLQTNYLVLSAGGAAIEYVEGKGGADVKKKVPSIRLQAKNDNSGD